MQVAFYTYTPTKQPFADGCNDIKKQKSPVVQNQPEIRTTKPINYYYPLISFGFEPPKNCAPGGGSNDKGWEAGMKYRIAILGCKEFADPLQIKRLNLNKYDCNFSLYGIGNLHLMFMPKKQSYSLVDLINSGDSKDVFENLHKLKGIVNFTNLEDTLYICESGSCKKQVRIDEEKAKKGETHTNKTHVHLIAAEDLDINKMKKNWGIMSERKILELKDISLEKLYTLLSSFTKGGKYGYKYIAKQKYNDINKFDVIFFIENDPNVPRKSQVLQALFAHELYCPNMPVKKLEDMNELSDYYDYKKLPLNIEEGTYDQIARIKKNRKLNTQFIDELKHCDLLKTIK